MIRKQVLRYFWCLTALATILLIVATISLGSFFWSQRELGQVAYIKSDLASVSIRSNPNTAAQVVSVFDGGTQVYIEKATERHGMVWAQVRFGDTIGWLPYTNLSQHPQQ